VRVPLNPAWTGSESQLDLKAVYRRQKRDNWGKPILDAQGREQWDTTSPLPLRRHHDWLAKGYEYITLADEESLKSVAGGLEHDWRTYMNDKRTRSPFSSEVYQAEQKEALDKDIANLIRLVKEHGAESVEATMRSMRGENWTLPVEVLAAVTEPVPVQKAKA